MGRSFLALLNKDFRMMLSGKFLLLILGSLVLYSCYIHFVYVKIDQDIYPVYLYDPTHTLEDAADQLIRVNTPEELEKGVSDGYAVGLDNGGTEAKIMMVTSGLESTDQIRAAYALSLLSPVQYSEAERVGRYDKETKSRREITGEFLFFELSAVGFLGLASTLFKEKHMGVIRVHGITPVSKSLFILSKLLLFLLADLVFACLLTVVNLGAQAGLNVLPAVLIQTCILSLIMALAGFFCAIWLPDFKQFSLFYLLLAIFITTPVFLVGQTNVAWSWVYYHPMYHLFIAIKSAYFQTPIAGAAYYLACAASVVLLFLLARKALSLEMVKEG